MGLPANGLADTTVVSGLSIPKEEAKSLQASHEMGVPSKTQAEQHYLSLSSIGLLTRERLRLAYQAYLTPTTKGVTRSSITPLPGVKQASTTYETFPLSAKHVFFTFSPKGPNGSRGITLMLWLANCQQRHVKAKAGIVSLASTGNQGTAADFFVTITQQEHVNDNTLYAMSPEGSLKPIDKITSNTNQFFQ